MCQADTTRGGSSQVQYHQSKSGADGKPDHVPLHTSRNAEFIPLPEDIYGGPGPSPRDVEMAFRHSGWRKGRDRVLAALRVAGAAAGRIRRFRECGSMCFVEYSRKAAQYRFRANYCGDRMCIPCCNGRAKLMQAKLRKLIGNNRVRMLTFTRLATDRTLADALTDLRTPFRNVRESVLWRCSVKGGASFVEIKRGRDGVRWHVHLHCLVVGTWIDGKALRALWLNATGDSFVVDVRTGDNREKFIGYASAYASKGWGRDLLDDPAGLVECIRTLGGRRLSSTFGTWWGAELDDDVEAVADWRVVGRLHVVYSAALRGGASERGVFTGAGVVATAVAGEARFVKLARDPITPAIAGSAGK